MQATADPLIGRVLEGRYRIRARVAVGGMSTVYAAVDERLDREVAVKVMASSLSSDPAFVDRFAREARAAARLSHVNAVSVYDQGSDATHVFLVMELVRGRTLRDLLHERGVLSPAEAVSLMEPVLAALASAHRAGLVHRDVKPENILLSDEGVVKVADFGLARAVETNAASTRTGLMMGTVAYSSPEQFRGGNADMRSDVYSAGVVLFELLTGRQPHLGADAMSVAYAHVHTDVPPPSRVRHGIAPPFDDLLRRVTARDPAARPADAGVFLGELHDLRRELRLPVLAVPRRPRPPRMPEPPARAGAGADTWSQPDSWSRAATTFGWSDGSGPVEDLSAARTAPDPRPGGPDRGGVTPVQHTKVAPGAPPPSTPAPAAAVGGTSRPAGAPSPRGSGAAPRAEAAPRAGAAPRSEAASGPNRGPDRAGPGPLAGGRAKRRRRPVLRAFVGGLVLLLVAAAITAASWYYTSGRYSTIPDVRDQPVARAVSMLRARGFEVVTDDPQPSETVAKGVVIKTDPGTGDRLVRGRPVHVTASAGPTYYTVPTVADQTRAGADQLLNPLRAHNIAIKYAERSDDKIKAGQVILTDPGAGAQVRQGATLLVYLSTGPPIVVVTDVTGKPVADATRTLTKLGFEVEPREDFSDTVAEGAVIRQNPKGGAQERKGSTVRLTVSKGPDLVTVPALPDPTSLEDATQTMRNAGLNPRIQDVSGLESGLVVSTDPAAGVQVKRGSTVILNVF